MAVNIWVKDDIRNILLTALYACSQITKQSTNVDPQSYTEGFHTALSMVAINFGIALPPTEINREAIQNPMNLLEDKNPLAR